MPLALNLSIRRSRPLQPVDDVAKGKNGVPVYQARTGVAHHLFDFLPPVGPITVNAAPGAGRFMFPETAFIETFERVTEQFLTPGTYRLAFMAVAAVKRNHDRYRRFFSVYPRISVSHIPQHYTIERAALRVIIKISCRGTACRA